MDGTAKTKRDGEDKNYFELQITVEQWSALTTHDMKYLETQKMRKDGRKNTRNDKVRFKLSFKQKLQEVVECLNHRRHEGTCHIKKQMDGRTRKKFDGKSQKLLRETNQRKQWSAMTTHVMKVHGTKED